VTILEFDDKTDRYMVYLESAAGGELVENAEDVSGLRGNFRGRGSRGVTGGGVGSTDKGRTGRTRGPMNTEVKWRKSSYSGNANDCVELKVARESISVRDTKDREGGTLTVGAQQFAAFLAAVK
jgi:hypothetical protein